MKIEKLTENKLKVMFSSTELEDNNISIHSFLANSKETQNFFLAILNIANEDLNFELNTSQITYDTISFSNKYFVIIITKKDSTKNSFMNVYEDIFFKFNNANELFEFCDVLKSILPTLDFKSTLYQYNNIYFLKFDFSDLDSFTINRILLIILEFKNYIKFSDLSLSHFEEFSNVIIKDSAIQSLI